MVQNLRAEARERYCPQCRLGRLADDGRCPLCGAVALPASGLRAALARLGARLAEFLAEPPAWLGAALGLAALAAGAYLVIVVLPRALATDAAGHQFNPFAGVAGLLAAPARPANPVVALLWFGIGQGIVFAVLMLALLILHSRRQRRARADRQSEAKSEGSGGTPHTLADLALPPTFS